jgi:DNA-binding CsgD family transcriptional regulator
MQVLAMAEAAPAGLLDGPAVSFETDLADKPGETLLETLRAVPPAPRQAAPVIADLGLELWRELAAGRWSFVDCFARDGSAHFVARRNTPRDALRLALTARERTVIARTAVGQSSKVIAFDLGVSQATVWSDRARGMRKLGVKSLVALAGLLPASARGR